MVKKLLLPAVFFIIILIGLVVFAFQGEGAKSPNKQVKTPHFTDSTPLDGEIYAAQPVNITINFNFDLARDSKILVTSKDGDEWTEGEVLIEDNNTALKRNLKQGMSGGDYLVKYTACFTDKSCQNGQFSFKIDSARKTEYQDFRGQSEVTLKMKNIKFAPGKIIISPGTTVIWENGDEVGHFVNTETHPEHTYYTIQNSKELLKTQTFSATFQTPGQYNYHCSAHVPEGMIGIILVTN